MEPDIAVVGGSLAGLDVARRLAVEGMSVRVYERAPRLDPLARSLIVTSKIRGMNDLPVEAAVTNEVHRYELFANGHRAEIALSEPDLVIERSTLVKALAARAADSGVQVVYGHRFQDIEPAGSHLRLTFRSKDRTSEEFTQTLIAADGANSAVARRAGWPKLRTVPVVQALVRLPHDQRADTTRVWFRPHDTRYFYWLIPESPTRGVLGLIGETPHTSRERLDSFMDEHRLTPMAYQAARIPAFERWTGLHRRVGKSDVFVVGDAAGHVKVSTVGGLHTGFRGARAVAGLVAGEGRGESRALRRELRRHMLVRRILNRFSQENYADLLSRLGVGGRRVLATYSRDDSRTLLWNLLRAEPELLLLCLRGVLVGKSRLQPSEGTRRGSSARNVPTATIQPINK